ncbi:MAG: LysM peptidoglycan-binding domain-containing protein [Oscillospiraceae bacterium]|nr:LysM peptidoglycan-binding domain-containing protein [Oscillospiraceae bacterium]
MTIHIVSTGETVQSIAQQYGVSPWLLAQQNQLPEDSALAVGQALIVQFPVQTHTVSRGESLYGIARRYGVTVQSLLQNNYFLLGHSTVRPGQELIISLREPTGGKMEVIGYAYPIIAQEVLSQQLPYLHALLPFTYGITAEGGLIPPGDERLVESARSYGVAPWMSLSTLTEMGNFSSPLAQRLLTSPAARERLVQAVADTMQHKGYRGLGVDFEYLPAVLGLPYATFIADLRRRLAPLGYPVMVALAPKTADNQPGILYEGHDYAALGAGADLALLMTYEWGYTYGPPMAVSPLPQVRRVVEYARSVIPPEKILLGMPTYGYDWTLPYERGETRAQSLSPQSALALARQYGVAIRYDETAQSPWFRYEDGQRQHEVWFEDARSAQAKLALVPQYGLRGVGLWNLTRLFPQLFVTLNDQYVLRP